MLNGREYEKLAFGPISRFISVTIQWPYIAIYIYKQEIHQEFSKPVIVFINGKNITV